MARSRERTTALSHAPADVRTGLAAVFALDTRLGDVLRSTRQPLAGQLRLAWWREALATLGSVPPDDPLLATLAPELLPRGIAGARLVTVVDGWEVLLAERLDMTALVDFARQRGGGLFGVAASLLGVDADAVAAAGEAWALADLAGHVSDPAIAALAGSMAADRFAVAFRHPWRRALRPLGAVALLARSDLADGRPGSFARSARLATHRLTGR